MQKKYEFTVSIVVEGVFFDAGATVEKSDLTIGYFESLMRLGQLKEVTPPQKTVQKSK